MKKEGLKALERIRWNLNNRGVVTSLDLEIIEKELKQAEENKKVLNIFKNALTIERHDNTVLEKPSDDLDLQGTISYLTRQVITIKQNELDKSLRDTLREWVLKNAFPKDLKVLEIIKQYVGVELIDIINAIKEGIYFNNTTRCGTKEVYGEISSIQWFNGKWCFYVPKYVSYIPIKEKDTCWWLSKNTIY